jgi:hypothetical protein
MNTPPLPHIPQEVTEDQVGPLLRELSEFIRAGSADLLRAEIMHTAIHRFGWTQERVAEECRISQPAVSKAMRKVGGGGTV